MPFRVVRNDITKMNTEAIVNTANDRPLVGAGCDTAVYKAAGYDQLLAYRTEKIGPVPEGEVFITPGFDLPARYIIHAVSPLYKDGKQKEEELLRSCYRKSLQLAGEKNIRSIAFPLISTGSFGYPKEEGMRIAVDEIHAFLLTHDMMIYLVVFDDKATSLGRNIYPDLENYIDQNYVELAQDKEYGSRRRDAARREYRMDDIHPYAVGRKDPANVPISHAAIGKNQDKDICFESALDSCMEFEETHESQLQERMKHISDTFSEYLMYLIQKKHMENAEVWKRGIVDRKVFSKIKNKPDYHPQKLTALCLCIGAMLNLDETKDLLARAGYALSPCDKTDIIFSYFIENKIYDMIELDIQLEGYGLPCIIE